MTYQNISKCKIRISGIIRLSTPILQKRLSTPTHEKNNFERLSIPIPTLENFKPDS